MKEDIESTLLNIFDTDIVRNGIYDRNKENETKLHDCEKTALICGL